MYDELIQQARELCEGTSTNYYTDVLVPQLCDALEAEQKETKHYQTLASQSKDLTARAEKAEAENRWIPVNKRLPKITEYRNENRYKSMDSNELVPFLVCCKDTEIPFRAFYDGKNWGDGWNKLKVTHWMPLPEMPKEAVAMRLEGRGREYKHD